MKRLKKGHSTIGNDAAGFPRDATGHRTDLPPVYNHLGMRLWRAEELLYGQGQRVRAVQPNSPSMQFLRMAQGECGTIWRVPEYVRREYIVLSDGLMEDFERTKSGLYLTRMPEHFLEPE
jgi:hypothetical protein